MMYPYNPYQAPQSLIRVTGIDGARAYQMPANSSVALFDGNQDVFYVKSTDGAGFPTIRAYRFEPIQDSPPEAGITRAEFDNLRHDLDALKEALNGQQSVRKPKSAE